MDREAHWFDVYAAREPRELTWYRSQLNVSLELIANAGITASSPVIDIGGGTSTLVDDLLQRGFSDLTVLDIAASALKISRARLGGRSDEVQWLTADVTAADLPSDRYALWHDRAAFHFLVDPADRAAYMSRLRRSLVADGHVVMAAFSLAGPERCSGLEIVRYGPTELAAELGPEFELCEHRTRVHTTPRGGSQDFLHARFARVAGGQT